MLTMMDVDADRFYEMGEMTVVGRSKCRLSIHPLARRSVRSLSHRLLESAVAALRCPCFDANAFAIVSGRMCASLCELGRAGSTAQTAEGPDLPGGKTSCGPQLRTRDAHPPNFVTTTCAP